MLKLPLNRAVYDVTGPCYAAVTVYPYYECSHDALGIGTRRSTRDKRHLTALRVPTQATTVGRECRIHRPSSGFKALPVLLEHPSVARYIAKGRKVLCTRPWYLVPTYIAT